MNQMSKAPLSGQNLVIHSTFCIERFYPHSPARVFFAFTNEAMVRRWRVEGEGWKIFEFTFDCRVGGSEVSRFSYMNGPEIRLDARFQDFVPDRRIVYTYRMALGPQPLSASLTTVELVPSGNGARLTFTEQGAFFDGVDSAQGREEGCRGLMERLAEELQRSS